MVVKKSAALNIRIDPNIKEAVRIAAMQDHRSIANLVEMLIIKHCKEVSISIPKQQNIFDDNE